MNDLSLDHIPGTPHKDLLKSLAELAWANPAIQAIWVGGSIASGKSDQESDIDFRVAIDEPTVETWPQVDWDNLLPLPPVGMTTLRFGPKAILHHMLLDNGVLLDYYIQTCDTHYAEVAVKLIAARTDELAETIRSFSGAEVSVHVDVDPERVRPLFVDYCIITHKEMKAIHRNQALMTTIGLHHERMSLLRALFIQQTGKDLDARPTIHALSAMITAISDNGQGPWVELGSPVRSLHEAKIAIELIRDRMSAIGHALADKMGFAYPERLEAVVREAWESGWAGVESGEPSSDVKPVWPSPSP